MHNQNNVWQSNAGYWQNLFIHQNILTIGYTAWHGFSTVGRGMVLCEVDLAIAQSINWVVDTVPHQMQFIPQSQVIPFLQQLEWESDDLPPVQQTLISYLPTREIVLLITGGGQIDIHFLRNLMIAPADCYKQVERRWDEFYLGLTPNRRSP